MQARTWNLPPRPSPGTVSGGWMTYSTYSMRIRRSDAHGSDVAEAVADLLTGLAQGFDGGAVCWGRNDNG